jgi:hypothetical protein
MAVLTRDRVWSADNHTTPLPNPAELHPDSFAVQRSPQPTRATMLGLFNDSPRLAMGGNGEGKISAVEKVALDILAVGAGIVLAFVIWDMTVNLLMYHSLFEPRHLPGGTDLGGGFALLMTIPWLFILFPTCIVSGVWLLRKLR